MYSCLNHKSAGVPCVHFRHKKIVFFKALSQITRCYTSLHSLGYLPRPKDRRNLLNLFFGLNAKIDLQSTLTSCGRLGT